MSRKNVNYNKMFEEPAQVEHFDDIVEEVAEMAEIAPEPELEPEEYLLGKVVKCDKLRVRKEPDTNAPVAKEIVKGTEVMIDPEKSTDDFYSVVTESGVEGFCMKKFIKIL